MIHRLLLDTSSLVYRAFFALPTPITDSRRRPVNAARGSLDTTARLVGSRRPDEVCDVFDHDWRPAGCVAAYPGYKPTRDDGPTVRVLQTLTGVTELVDPIGGIQRSRHAPGARRRSGLSARCRRLRGAVMVLAVLVGSLVLSACGEQDPDLEIPPRAEGQMVLDQAGVLDDDRVAAALDAIEGWDVVAVTYETSQANAGEAHRAGEAVIAAWDVDVVLVAVAHPGDFTSTDETRRRFFGATPVDVRAVPAGVREALADAVVPGFSVDNDWSGAFEAAAQRLAEER